MGLASARADILAEAVRSIDMGAHSGLVALTVPCDDVDPSALVLGSRRATDRWSVWEQPDRDGFSLATLGTVKEFVSRGPNRFSDVEADATAIISRTERVGPEEAPQGTGPIFVGGFSFAPEGCSDPEWSSLPPAMVILPEISVCRIDGDCWLTVVVDLDEGSGSSSDSGTWLSRLEARLASLTEVPLPLDLGGVADSEPARIVPGSREWGPAAYEQGVEEATARISRGEFEKVVLARSLRLERRGIWDPALVVGAMRGLFPSCFCFAVGTPELTFCGASPELLIRRSGPMAATVALAGSTRRSADPAVDSHLGEALLRSAKDREEHQIVVSRIERMLDPVSLWVDSGDEPSLAKISNIQHLATPVRAQLSDPVSALRLAGALHPTPAVGGEPNDAALQAIAEIEQMDRGWYAGPVGWMDFTGDGEFCVALRSALLRDSTATLYAGAGIVSSSDAGNELAETELKMGAMLPLLS